MRNERGGVGGGVGGGIGGGVLIGGSGDICNFSGNS